MSAESDPLTESSQPLLPGMQDLGSELLRIDAPAGSYSGKIIDRDAARVQGILAARSMGLSVRQVCAAYRVGHHTLAELERRHSGKMATLKSRLASRLGVFAELGIDRMLTDVERMDLDRLPVAVAIAIDKLQVLTGEPSVIVGHEGSGARQWSVDALRDRLAGVIDVTPAPGMGFAGEKDPQSATGRGLGAGVIDADAGEAEESADDTGSD